MNIRFQIESISHSNSISEDIRKQRLYIGFNFICFYNRTIFFCYQQNILKHMNLSFPILSDQLSNYYVGDIVDEEKKSKKNAGKRYVNIIVTLTLKFSIPFCATPTKITDLLLKRLTLQFFASLNLS